MLLPVDPVYLTVLALPSGGAQSDFILLFTVQLISVTLLASPRAGIRLALWDSVLLLSVTLFQLGGPLGQALGTPQVVTPTAGAVALRIGGFWAVALTTASFSALERTGTAALQGPSGRPQHHGRANGGGHGIGLRAARRSPPSC